MANQKSPLRRGWALNVKSAMLHVIALAQYALTHTRGWAATSPGNQVRFRSEIERLNQQITLLQEELRIKNARLRRIAPNKRPHYSPVERMAILELRAARGWSNRQVANTFLVSAATIRGWMKRLDDQGPNALVQVREPVNKFPEFVRHAVQRLKILCPTLGKVKIAQVLCRAGLHMGATTVGRILKEFPQPTPNETKVSSGPVVSAKKPNEVWHVDLTIVPTGGGLWAPWLYFALPQCWPFCWWIAVVVDHYSRRAMEFAVFAKRPQSIAVRTFLGNTIARIGATPRYIICDKDRIFWCDGFKRWCQHKSIGVRYGAAGKHGSIAVVERFIKSLKNEHTRRILVPQRRATFRKQLHSFTAWYNEHRPHTMLDGATPNEVYFNLKPANQYPRIEPRKHWPRSSPCARPRTLIAGQPGDRFIISVDFHDSRRHLPIVSLKHAA